MLFLLGFAVNLDLINFKPHKGHFLSLVLIVIFIIVSYC